jgi:predicted RNase H-like HicB family nuclease
MLTKYIHAALRDAHYEILEDCTYYGDIPGFQGVYADASTLEGCREQLQEVLEGWLILGLRLGHHLPKVGGLRIDVVAEETL